MRKLLALLIFCLCAGFVAHWLSPRSQHAALDPATQLGEPRPLPADAALSAETAERVQAPSSREALADAEARQATAEVSPRNEAHLGGRVVAFETKQPIAGARVQLLQGKMVLNSMGAATWSNSVLAETKTGADGGFELPFTSSAGQLLQVEAEGWASAWVQVSRRDFDPAQAFVVELLGEGSLTVHVIDASGGDVPGVDVHVDSSASESALPAGERNAPVPDQHWEASTRKDGRATIRALPPAIGLHAWAVRRNTTLWAEPELITLQSGESRELLWRIATGTRLSGIVLDQRGDPVVKQVLWIAKRHADSERYFQEHHASSAVFGASTDAAGRFVFEDVPAGRWSIGPAAEKVPLNTEVASAIAPKTVAIDLAGEPARELTLRVDRGLYIRGTVTAPDHGSVRGGSVSLEGGGLPGIPVTPQGTFVLGPVAEGDCVLVARCMGRYADSDPTRARAGDVGVNLQLRFGGSLRCQMVDALSGLPCKGYMILSPELPGRFLGDGQTGSSVDGDGTVTWPALAPGRYGIAALSEDGRCAVQAGIEVSAGVETTGIVLSLKPSGWIRLSYHGKKSGMTAVVKSSGVPSSFPLWISASRKSGACAPAGAVVLEIRDEYQGPARTRQVELEPGETKEIVITDED